MLRPRGHDATACGKRGSGRSYACAPLQPRAESRLARSSRRDHGGRDPVHRDREHPGSARVGRAREARRVDPDDRHDAPPCELPERAAKRRRDRRVDVTTTNSRAPGEGRVPSEDRHEPCEPSGSAGSELGHAPPSSPPSSEPGPPRATRARRTSERGRGRVRLEDRSGGAHGDVEARVGRRPDRAGRIAVEQRHDTVVGGVLELLDHEVPAPSARRPVHAPQRLALLVRADRVESNPAVRRSSKRRPLARAARRR